jgi:S-adenosylmethionine hydrolase
MPVVVVTLLTDFGTRDAYVAAMKGVILGICPEARLVDVTHEVPPQNVRAAAFLLAQAAPYFPRGTIHLAVVDPGVGSARRAVAVLTERAVFVGPDNGLFSLCLRNAPAWRAVEIANPRLRAAQVSSTFHGRDLFAPAAAHLARGVPFSELGPPVQDLVEIALQAPEVRGGVASGQVLHVDVFGNLVTDLAPEHLPTSAHLEVEGHHIGALVRTYADVSEGALCALVGSSGLVEISVRNGSAAERLGVGVGASVRAKPRA